MTRETQARALRATIMITTAAAAAACRDLPDIPQPALTGLGTPPAAFVDATHGGNASFFFLPPIAPRANGRGALDVSLTPVVEVCEWSANACAARPVSRLTARLEDEHYAANWTTNGLGLDPSKAYHLRVLVAGSELGSADLAVVNNASESKSVDASRYVAVVNKSTLPIKFRIERGAVWVVGSAGAQISAMSGQVRLDIPAGALASDVGITVQHASNAPSPSGTGFVVAGAVFDFGPPGLTFATPARLTIGYDPANLPAGRAERDLRLLHGVNAAWQPVAGSVVDEQANTVSGLVASFSPYAPGSGSLFVFKGFGTATIDGLIGTNEWAGATCSSFTLNTTTVCVMNDGQNLYVSVRYFEGVMLGGTNSLKVELDQFNDGRTPATIATS